MSTRRFRTRSGSLLHVQEYGQGPAVLALHGLGGGAWFFAGLGNRLAHAHRVISVDLPGTGRSSCPAGFTPLTWTDDLGDLVAEVVGTPVVLLGHSMGTIVALHAWSAWPGNIRALIFVGGLPEPRPLIKERLAVRAAAAATNGLAGMGPQAAAANFARATLERQPELVALFERVFESQDAAIYIQWCQRLIEASAESIVRTVRAPCLSITGAEDQYAPPDLVAAFMDELPSPGRVEVLPDCGHLPFLEAPELFARTVASFLATVC